MYMQLGVYIFGHVKAQFAYKTYSGHSYLMNVAICIKSLKSTEDQGRGWS